MSRSGYSAVLGVPVALIGLVGFAGTFGVAYAGAFHPRSGVGGRVRPLLVLLAGAGVVLGTYLTGIEVFVLHTVCALCVASFGIGLGVFALAIALVR